jgi:DNA repair protein RadC
VRAPVTIETVHRAECDRRDREPPAGSSAPGIGATGPGGGAREDDGEAREDGEIPEAYGGPSRADGAAELLRALRPRPKLEMRGAGALSHAELVEVLLGPGTSPAVLAAVGRVLRSVGLSAASQWPVERLRSAGGLGRETAARLSAAFELGRRAAAPGPERKRLCRPAQVYEQVRRIGRARKERLVGLYLDAQNGLLHRETISVGSLNTTRTHPREILYPAIAHLALGFILAHNHPSGCLDPSPEDVEFTHAVRRAGELMGIELYDHLIVGTSGYTSLRERGLL